MSAVRKLILAAVMGLATVTSLTLPADLRANPHNSNQRVYYVYYRDCPDSQWTCYGGYYQYDQAIQAKTWFEYYGYQVFIR